MDGTKEQKVPVRMLEIFRQKALDGDATFAIAYALMELAREIHLRGRTELTGTDVNAKVVNAPIVSCPDGCRCDKWGNVDCSRR